MTLQKMVGSALFSLLLAMRKQAALLGEPHMTRAVGSLQEQREPQTSKEINNALSPTLRGDEFHQQPEGA